MDTYNSFIASKAITVEAKGFKVDISELNPMLFDFQKDIVRWAFVALYMRAWIEIIRVTVSLQRLIGRPLHEGVD